MRQHNYFVGVKVMDKIYDREVLRGAVLEIYRYLSNNFVGDKRPHQYKPDKPTYRKALEEFVDSLPESAGFEFLWDFLSYQFYIFSYENHARRPQMAWFIGKQAWKRWYDYDEGAKYHAKEWCAARGLSNPIIKEVFVPLGKNVFDAERMQMSRRVGPDYCRRKVADNPYTYNSGVCAGCPFDELCHELFEGKM